MTTGLIIWLVLIIVAGLIIYKITKSIFKAIFLALSVGVIIIIILGGLIISDINDFRENAQTQPNIYLLEDNGEIIAGFSGILGEDFQPDFVEEELGPYNNLDGLLGNNYKLFLVKKQALGSVEEVEGEDITLTRQEILDMIASDSPVDDFIKKQYPNLPAAQLSGARQSLLSQMEIENDAEFKGTLFAATFASAMEEQGPLFIFDQYKEGNIIIHPETAMFKFLKIIPSSILKNVITTAQRGE